MDWTEVEPVLLATYGLLGEDEEDENTTQEAVCEALGRPPGDAATIRALTLLYQDGYIDGITLEHSPAPVFIRTTGRGLRETSGWPREGRGADQLDLLLRLLDERIDSDDTPEEEKGKLRRIRDGVGDASRDIIVGVLAAYVSKVTGAGNGG